LSGARDWIGMVDKEPVEIFSQAFDLQRQFLDVRMPILSIDEKRSVEVVEGVVDPILLFESGERVRFVILKNVFEIERKFGNGESVP